MCGAKISSIFVAFLENMNFNFQLTSFLTTHQIQQQIPKVRIHILTIFLTIKINFFITLLVVFSSETTWLPYARHYNLRLVFSNHF